MASKEDVRFGRLAIAHHFVTREELARALREQERRRLQEGLAPPLGDLLVSLGMATQSQVDQILAEQSGDSGAKMLGGYELLERIATGGMGAVYKARQKSLNRIVALKVLPQRLARDMDFIARFYREARAVARFNHPNIVSGYEVGEADGYHYLAMEFVDGPSSAAQLAASPSGIAVEEVLDVALQIAEALQHAHDHGIIHRDIKPENILIAADGTAKLCDLGLARSSNPEDDVSLTQAGMAVGTPYYISPEQARGRQDIDPRADIYSFGATIFHLVTGRPLFTGDNPLQIMTRHLEDPPPLAAEASPAVSPELSAVIDKMVAKQPDDRYQSVNQVAEDLRMIAAGQAPVHAVTRRAPETPPATRRTRRRQPTGRFNTRLLRTASASRRRSREIAAAIAVLVLALAGGGLYHWSTRRLKPPPRKRTERKDPHRPGLPNPGGPDRREVADQARFERAEDWAKKHKDDLRGQIERFEAVARHAGPRSPWGLRAAGRSAQLQALLDEAIAQAFEPLRKKAHKLVAARRYGSAVALLRTLPSDFSYAHEPTALRLAEAEIKKCEAAGLARWETLLADSRRLLEAGDYSGARRTVRVAADFGLPDVTTGLRQHLASISKRESVARAAAATAVEKLFAEFLPRFRRLMAERKFREAASTHTSTRARMTALTPDLAPEIAREMQLELADLETAASVYDAVSARFRKLDRRLRAGELGERIEVYSRIHKRSITGTFDGFDTQAGTVAVTRKRGKERFSVSIASWPCEQVLKNAGLSWSPAKRADAFRLVVFVSRDKLATATDLKIVSRLVKRWKFDPKRYPGKPATPSTTRSSEVEQVARRLLSSLEAHIRGERWQQAASAADSLLSGPYDTTRTLAENRDRVGTLRQKAAAALAAAAAASVRKLTLQYGSPAWDLGIGYFRGAMDTSVRHGPHKNTSFGDSRELTVVSSSSRALLYFNLASLPRGPKLRSAKLELFCVRGSTQARKIRACCLASRWHSGTAARSTTGATGATWLHALRGPTGNYSWKTPGGDVDTAFDLGKGPGVLDEAKLPDAGHWLSLDVTTAVREVLQGRRRNYGFMLTGKEIAKPVAFASSEAILQMAERRPRLVLELVNFKPPYAAPRSAEHTATSYRFTTPARIASFAGDFILRSGISGKRATRGIRYTEGILRLQRDARLHCLEARKVKWTGDLEISARVAMPAGGIIGISFGKAMVDSKASCATFSIVPEPHTASAAFSSMVRHLRPLSGTMGCASLGSESALVRKRLFPDSGKCEIGFIKQGYRLRIFAGGLCVAEMALTPRETALLAREPVRLYLQAGGAEDDDQTEVAVSRLYVGPPRSAEDAD